MTLNLPQWLATLILAVVLIALTELGFRVARWTHGRKPETKDDKGGVGYMLSGALALLGLLIGFTFSMAADRYDSRRLLVNDEANAIGTAYLRSRLAVGPDAAVMHEQWAGYAEIRYALRLGHKSEEELLALIAQGNAVQTRIWASLKRETAAARDDITATMVDATNEAFDIAATRQAAALAHVPPGVIWSVIVYAMIASIILGHALAGDQRRFMMSSVLQLLIALSIALIIDLDRPTGGVIQVSQGPMDRLMETIRAYEAADKAAAAAVAAP